MSELSRLERLRHLFGLAPLPDGVEVGIGDDAAVLAPGRASLVWTVDSAVEGVHFRRDWMSLEDIGYRSVMAAVSDVAAMGGRPRGVLSGLVLPADFTDDELERLARGQAEAAMALGTAVLGGNLAAGSELSITTTVLGEAATPLLRGGAKVGDVVAVAGALGLAAAGLEALRRGLGGHELSRAIEVCRRPRALVTEGASAASWAHAAIDISDGLVLDVWRLAQESQLGISLRAESLRLVGTGELDRAADALSLDPLELALHGGEDYALLVASPSDSVKAPFVTIGVCIAEPGVFLEAANGQRDELEPRGFDHFAR